MKPRPALSEADALMLLNFELSAYEECADCRFDSVGPVKPASESCDRKICGQVLEEVRSDFRVAPTGRVDLRQYGARPRGEDGSVSNQYKERTMFKKGDFALQAKNFDLTNEWNILRIMAGALMFPHVAGKFVSWMTLSQPTVEFFAKAGMVPGDVWVWIAACAEALSGICLVLGICTRYAALGAAAVLGIAAWALLTARGVGWVWNKGGVEYPVFWAVTCLLVAVHEFKTLYAGMPTRSPAARALAALKS